MLISVYLFIYPRFLSYFSLWQILHQMIIVRVWYLCYTYLHSPHIWYTHKIEKNMQGDAGVMAGLNQQEVIQGCSITEMSGGERRNLQHRQPNWVSLFGIWHEQNQACYMCMIQQSLSCLGELACRLWSIFVYAALRKAYTLYLFFSFFFVKQSSCWLKRFYFFRFWWSPPSVIQYSMMHSSLLREGSSNKKHAEKNLLEERHSLASCLADDATKGAALYCMSIGIGQQDLCTVYI